MKHKIISKEHKINHENLITVQLLPENEMETKAIQNVEKAEATKNEKELVDNYLNFSLRLGNYSIIELVNQKKNVFVLKIFI
ncbi:MAG: hypothetical protein Q8N03_14680 [Ignavibacteria bacterium]|nr:hypothetical protein [Ignavibacteria bacterium]MDP3829930.1 hypothetical protein [Ignavibacteriaceae bacterium]